MGACGRRFASHGSSRPGRSGRRGRTLCSAASVRGRADEAPAPSARSSRRVSSRTRGCSRRRSRAATTAGLIALVMDDDGRIDPAANRSRSFARPIWTACCRRPSSSWRSCTRGEVATAVKPSGAPAREVRLARSSIPLEVFTPLDDVWRRSASRGRPRAVLSRSDSCRRERPRRHDPALGIFIGGFSGESSAVAVPALVRGSPASRLHQRARPAPLRRSALARLRSRVLRSPRARDPRWTWLLEPARARRDLGRRSLGGSGQALRFYHFSGYDPTRPDVLTTGSSRITFARRPNLRRLFDEYSRQLLAPAAMAPCRSATTRTARVELDGDRRRLFRES